MFPRNSRSIYASTKCGQFLKPGWAGKKNGVLLNLAAAQFPVFITVDKDLPHQQNIQGLRIMVVVLVTEMNDLESLLSLIPSLLEALEHLRPGEFVLLKD